MITFFNETLTRLKSEMPGYFKTIFWTGMIIVATPEFGQWIDGLLAEPDLLPNWLHAEWLKHIRLVAGGAAFTALLTRRDRAVIIQKENAQY